MVYCRLHRLQAVLVEEQYFKIYIHSLTLSPDSTGDLRVDQCIARRTLVMESDSLDSKSLQTMRRCSTLDLCTILKAFTRPPAARYVRVLSIPAGHLE